MINKICVHCNKPFATHNPQKIYCDREHYNPCPICGKLVKVTNNRRIKDIKCCSSKCSHEKLKQSLSSRICIFCGKKFSPNSGSQTVCDDIHYDYCEICGNKFIRTVKNKIDHVTTCSDKCTKEKLRRHSMQKYGVPHPMQNDGVKQNFCNAMIDKYGVSHALQNLDIKEKAKNTCMKNNDVMFGCQTKQCRNKLTPSMPNQNFSKFLKRLELNYETEFPIEDRIYDFQIENSKVFIEVNPIITHNILINPYGNKMDEEYHINKTKLAEKHGYRCIHVWDWDDWDKLKNILTPVTHKIYARKCKIYKLHKYVGDKFLGDYHLQGSCRGQLLYLGLVYGETLLQVMTFGKSRYNKNYDIELMRMCTLPGYSVIGGASRLFSFATKDYGLNNIITYCDRSKFTGDVYEKMGMKYLHTTPPQEIWSKEDKYITSNLLWRYGYDKLFRVEKEEGKTNIQHMLADGWLPIFDCGKSAFIYRKS